MKILVLLICLLLIGLAGCPSTPPPTFPPPETTSLPETTPPPEATPESPVPEFIEVPLSYEAEGYVRQVKGTETKTLQIGEYETSETEEGWLDIACVEVQNTDEASGTFLVIFSVAEPTFGDYLLEQDLELEPGEVGVVECPADELGDWSYEVLPSTKLVEK
jgi:hypothetical protein